MNVWFKPVPAWRTRELVQLVLVSLLGFTLVTSILFVLDLNETPVAGFTYTDTKAAVALSVLPVSSTFFFVLLYPKAILQFSNNEISKIAKAVDLFWYPLGVASAVLALASAEAGVLKRYESANASERERYFLRATERMPDAVESCRFLLEKKKQVLRRIRFTYDGVPVALSGTIDALCSKYSLLDQSLINYLEPDIATRLNQGKPLKSDLNSTFPQSEFNSPQEILWGPRRLTITAGCEELLRSKADIGQDLAKGYSINIRSDPLSSDSEAYSEGIWLGRHLTNLVDFCRSAAFIERADARGLFYERVHNGRILTFSNPWGWVLLLCFAAGLKLTKTLIELQLARTAYSGLFDR